VQAQGQVGPAGDQQIPVAHRLRPDEQEAAAGRRAGLHEPHDGLAQIVDVDRLYPLLAAARQEQDRQTREQAEEAAARPIRSVDDGGLDDDPIEIEGREIIVRRLLA
jgi:hypothetical protein